MSEEVKRWREQVKVLNNKIRKVENREETTRLKSVVGKYFIYRNNCYSCPEKKSDYWDVYYHVTKAEDGSVFANTFEKDKYGKIEFQKDKMVSESSMREEISKEKFLAKRDLFIKELESII